MCCAVPGVTGILGGGESRAEPSAPPWAPPGGCQTLGWSQGRGAAASLRSWTSPEGGAIVPKMGIAGSFSPLPISGD